MKLKVICPHEQIFEGNIKQVSLPTEIGEITVLPNHMPLVTVVLPWLIKIIPDNPEDFNTKTFVFEEQYLTISTSEGVAYIDGEHITIMSSTSTANPGTYAPDELKKQKESLEKQIEELKTTDDKKLIEKAEKKIQTIEADLKLINMQNNNG